MTTNSLNIKQFPVWVVNIRVQMSSSYIAYPLAVIVRGICLFDNFEKLSMLLGFSRDILAGWARGCCVHVILVIFHNTVILDAFFNHSACYSLERFTQLK